jgi:hypothetical protein
MLTKTKIALLAAALTLSAASTALAETTTAAELESIARPGTVTMHSVDHGYGADKSVRHDSSLSRTESFIDSRTGF